MLTVKLMYLIPSVLLACSLVVIGAVIGYLRGKRTNQLAPTEFDRVAMLRLMRELESWTSEYSGNVSEYQSRIGELSELAKRSTNKVVKEL